MELRLDCHFIPFFQWNFTFAVNCFQAENVPGELRIWSSQKVRAAQTACELRDLAANVEYWKVLDEIDAVFYLLLFTYYNCNCACFHRF